MYPKLRERTGLLAILRNCVYKSSLYGYINLSQRMLESR